MVRRILPAVFLVPWLLCSAQIRPCLVVTQQDVDDVRKGLGQLPLLDRSYGGAKATLEEALSKPMDVPLPVDAGGYTHERHKRNYAEMMLAGIMFQVSRDERYARFVRDMLLEYARLYPTLKTHPMAISAESSGKLFWQTLNETVWLVHAAQAYDCVYDWVSKSDRQAIENGVLRPLARFFITEHARELDRIHNHGTWMVSAVGMTGYVLRDSDLVQIALYGTNKDGSSGFIRQLDLLFSPDGYYTEGPYYVRYALWPFFLFAQAIDNNQPELKIFARRDGILRKAFWSAVQLTSPSGTFIPFNDALKEMSVTAKEIIVALDIVRARYGTDSNLIPLAVRQNRVMLNSGGVAVARDIALGHTASVQTFASTEFRDGPDGTQGGIGLLRSGSANHGSLLVMKYAAQGMGHGHFDRLGFLLYDNGREIIQDYGSARFINIEPKFGGRYLPENTSWAKQTIAHNTVIVDFTSHYQGKVEVAEQHYGDRHFFDTADPNFQVMSAKAAETYPGVGMQRTMALVRDPKLPHPVAIDVFRVSSSQEHTYDLPFYYLGHFMGSSVPYTSHDQNHTILGKKYGYQHLWLEAEGKASGPVQWTWLSGDRFYTVTSSADTNTQVLLARIGASDPNYNLRNEPAVILRQKAQSHVFASVIEPHGYFEPVEEISTGARPLLESVKVVVSNERGTVVDIRGKNSIHWILMVSNTEGSQAAYHSVTANGITYSWTGNCQLKKE